jgi:hypothetical protein
MHGAYYPEIYLSANKFLFSVEKIKVYKKKQKTLFPCKPGVRKRHTS